MARAARIFFPVVAALAWGFVAVLAWGCARPVVPDPKEAVRQYAEALERGDAAAVYDLMTDQAKQAYGREGTRRLLGESKNELARQARAIASQRAQVEASAVVPYEDGETAVLVLEEGTFRIAAAQAFPAGARTPAQALDDLRQVLARRSYPGLMRVLSAEARGALERDLRSLVEGLQRPETLPVQVTGDRAEVEIPGGHKVWLKREAGVWKIAEFE